MSGGMFAPLNWSGGPAKWIIATGVFELVLGGFFVVLGLVIPAAAGGMFVTAAILGATGIGLLAWGRRWRRAHQEADRVRSQGVPGTATISSMRQTGAYLNNNPQVEMNLTVTLAGRQPYQVVMREWVPLLMVGRLSAGAPLPVMVDPANPFNVIIDWTGTQRANPEEKQRILATGTAGTARIVQATPTGEVQDGRPIYQLQLEVNIPGHPPIQGPSRAAVDPEKASRIVAGTTLPVKADPANPMSIAVDWDRA
ncbi:MAG: hypothetical protein M3245_05205 [Actinomycetota bacterium]|nr:hypothetical protein [Actinomycetota bacterium]